MAMNENYTICTAARVLDQATPSIFHTVTLTFVPSPSRYQRLGASDVEPLLTVHTGVADAGSRWSRDRRIA